MNNTFNGYKNQETWLFMLWNEDIYEDTFLKNVIKKKELSDMRKIEIIKEYYRDIYLNQCKPNEPIPALINDLIQCAWQNIDFVQIYFLIKDEIK